MVDVTRKAESRIRRARRGETVRVASTAEPVTEQERVAAARARVVADRKRGVQTEPWIQQLAAGNA